MKKKKKKQKGLKFLFLSIGVFVLMLLIVLVMLLLEGGSGAQKKQVAQVTATPSPTSTPTPRPTRSAIPVEVNYTAVHDTKVKVFVEEYGEVREMYLEEYLIGVVAAEMPARYGPEALKAQAVAARTYTVYKFRHGHCKTHPEADICTNSGCCQAYATEEELAERWPDEFPYYYSVVSQAVMDTAGEVMTVGGKTINAMFHAASGGWTEDSEHVYGDTYNYLRGVESPYEEDSSDTVSYSRKDFVEKMNTVYPDAHLTVEGLDAEVRIESTFSSGRVETLRLGDMTVKGTKFRSKAGLKSTLFTIEFTKERIIFHTLGNGHGVGMSQYGAAGMAKQGNTYRQILSHYYTGVKFKIIGKDITLPEKTGNS